MQNLNSSTLQPAAFTEEHLSLLPQHTLHRLHNLAGTLCAALDDEQSRRNAQPRLAEDGPSPHSRALLSVRSRVTVRAVGALLDHFNVKVPQRSPGPSAR
jgi:hypothetical protein